MAASARSLPPREYVRLALRHRFCLAAPGDFVSTPKIAEFVLMGGLGGCLPVLVLRGEPAHMLPYTRWLDCCSSPPTTAARAAWAATIEARARRPSTAEQSAGTRRPRPSSASSCAAARPGRRAREAAVQKGKPSQREAT